MQAPLFVRPLTDTEHAALIAGIHSSAAFTLRRCHTAERATLLASARGERAPQIARALGYDDQTVRNAIHAFDRSGLDSLTEGSSHPHRIATAFDAATERFRAPLHQSPRAFGKATNLWTLDLAAEIAFPEETTDERVTGETIRVTLRRLGVRRQRAKQWITSPDPAYARKKQRDRLIRLTAAHPDGALGFADEVRWSRLARPHLPSWADDGSPLRLVAQTVGRDDRDPKALACYGLLVRTWDAAGERDERLAAQGETALLLVWDNASWHVSKSVRRRIRSHNRRVKHGEARVRIVVAPLPSKSPWLNLIEPKWVHGKRRIVEPARLLNADVIAQRVCDCFGCVHEPHLSVIEEVS